MMIQYIILFVCGVLFSSLQTWMIYTSYFRAPRLVFERQASVATATTAMKTRQQETTPIPTTIQTTATIQTTPITTEQAGQRDRRAGGGVVDVERRDPALMPPKQDSAELELWSGMNLSAFADLNNGALLRPPPKYDCRSMLLQPTFNMCVYAPDQDKHVSSAIIATGQWETSKATDMQAAWIFMQNRFPRKRVLFVDVGANLGLFSLYAAATGLENIIAFEPLPANAAIFATGIAANAGFSDRIKLVRAGAGAAFAKTDMFVHLTNRGGSSFSERKIKNIEAVPQHEQLVVHDVPIVPIDSVISRRVDVMKIDVEGFESCVIAGGPRLFGQLGVAVLFLEVWHAVCPCFSDNTPAFINYLVSLGYEFHTTFQQFRNGAPPTAVQDVWAAARAVNSAYSELVAIRRDLIMREQ